MEKQREELAKMEYYDPVTAYRELDSFKCNKIVAFQLRSFIQLNANNYKATDYQCLQAISCLNKSIDTLSYPDFQEMTLTNDIVLRNISLGRYVQMEVQVGTMGKVYEIKATSQRAISRFFTKEIEFYRNLLIRKQYFCSTYAGDLYTLSQYLCKGLKFASSKENKQNNAFTYQQFYEFARQKKMYFTKQQFIAIYKRTKSIQVASPFAYDIQNISQLTIKVQDLSHLLLAPLKKRQVKQKIRLVSGIPLDIQPPSYKNNPIWKRQQDVKVEQKHKNNLEFIQKQKSRDIRPIRYNFSYPSESLLVNPQVRDLRQLHTQWNHEVQNFGDQQIDIRYSMIDRKKYFL